MEKSVYKIISEEYLGYSLAVLKRAIPNLISGHKEVHSAIFYSSYKTNDFRKVEGIGAQVVLDKEATEYEHGANNASEAVVTISQQYVNGDNQIPMFETKGSFGTLIEPEAAATRYIQGKFNKKILDYMYDYFLSEQFKEAPDKAPKIFVPLLPMVILNGISGMAPGFAVEIHPRNPKKILKAIEAILKEEEFSEELTYPEWREQMVPTYRSENGKLTVEGKIENLGNGKWRITAIPPLLTFEKFRQNLEKNRSNGLITSYDDNSKLAPDVTLKVRNKELTDREMLAKLGLIKDVSAETLTTMFENNLLIFSNVIDLIKKFVEVRLSYYDIKRRAVIAECRKEIKTYENQRDCILEIMNEIKNEGKLLDSFKMKQISKRFNNPNISIYSLTNETVNNINEKIENLNKKINDISEKTNTQLYLEELEVLKQHL